MNEHAKIEIAPPADFAGLRELVLKRHKDLPKRLAQTARYAIDNPDEIAFGTVASISASADVQASTLVRLAQTLGFQGFSDLQALFQDRLKAQSLTYRERVDGAVRDSRGSRHGELAIAQGFLDSAARSVELLQDSLKQDELAQAVEMLAAAETIHVVAQRRSYPVAAYLGYMLAKLRIRATVAGTNSGVDDDVMTLATPRDAALVISFAPYASQTVDWTRLLAGNGVPIVAVSDSAFSPVAEMARVWISVVEEDYEGFRSLSATTALAAALAVAVARRRELNSAAAAGKAKT